MTRTPRPGDLALITPNERGAYTRCDATDTERWGLLVRDGDRRIEYVIAADYHGHWLIGPRWLRIETVEHDGWWVRDYDRIEEVTLADVLHAVGPPADPRYDLALDVSYHAAVRDSRGRHSAIASELLDELWQASGVGARTARAKSQEAPR
jgi:hypothetical protein